MPQTTKIIVARQDGTVVGQYFPGQGEYLIGRKPHCTIQIVGDHVSREHARLIISVDAIEVEDLDSTTGTYLDGVEVKGRIPIQPGQNLWIGDFHIDIETQGIGDLVEGSPLNAAQEIQELEEAPSPTIKKAPAGKSRKKWAYGIAAAVALLVVIGIKVVFLSNPDKAQYPSSAQMINDKGILYVLGDSEPYTGPIIDYHPNGVKSYKVEVKQGVPQGTATEWYKSGQKMTETTLENGQATGAIKGWYPSGKQEYEMPIKDGEIDGVGTEYYENGTKKSETPYVKGSRNGRELGYAETGHKLWEAIWRDGKLHGGYIEFYASGKTNNLTPYITGLNKGTSIGWHETGEKAWKAKWDGGKPVGTHYEWFPGGQMKRQQSFANGKMIMIVEWYANGQKTMEASYSNGKLTAQKRWNADGKLVIASGTSAPPTAPVQGPVKPKPNPNAPGRRKPWFTTEITAIYMGKTTVVLETAFGTPDAKRGDTWVYGNMTIINPTTRQRLTTANFLIRDGKVVLVEAN